MKHIPQIIILALILYWWFGRKGASKKAQIVDDVISGSSNICSSCATKYAEMELAKQDLFDYWEANKDVGGGDPLPSAQMTPLTIVYRGLLNDYLRSVKLFLECLENNNITPRADYSPSSDFPANTHFTHIVYFNVYNSMYPAERLDPYLAVARWSPSDPYFIPSQYYGTWLRERANLKDFGERGLVFDFSDVVWNCNN